MLVHQIDVEATHLRPQVLKLLTLCIRTRTAHDLDLWITSPDRLHKRGQSLGIQLSPMLVADSNVFQAERRRMPHICPQFAPAGSDRSVGKLDQIQGIIDVGLQLLYWHMLLHALVLKLAGEPAIQDGQRLRAQILTQLKIFEEAQTVRLVIVGEFLMREGVVPTVDVERTILHRPHRVFPLITGLNRRTLHDTSTGETENAWFQGLQCLR